MHILFKADSSLLLLYSDLARFLGHITGFMLTHSNLKHDFLGEPSQNLAPISTAKDPKTVLLVWTKQGNK